MFSGALNWRCTAVVLVGPTPRCHGSGACPARRPLLSVETPRAVRRGKAGLSGLRANALGSVSLPRGRGAAC